MLPSFQKVCVLNKFLSLQRIRESKPEKSNGRVFYTTDRKFYVQISLQDINNSFSINELVMICSNANILYWIPAN